MSVPSATLRQALQTINGRITVENLRRAEERGRVRLSMEVVAREHDIDPVALQSALLDLVDE